MTYFYVMKRKRTLPQLTKAEEEVMQIIWGLGHCLVRDILDKLGNADIPHSTISSVVRILEKKGFVDHKAYGKTHEYFPVVTQDDYAGQEAQSLVKKYFSGSAKSLVSFLVQGEQLDLTELGELMKALTADAKKKKS